jgi:hypothetical protein
MTSDRALLPAVAEGDGQEDGDLQYDEHEIHGAILDLLGFTSIRHAAAPR